MNEFFKPTKRKLVALGILSLLTIYVLLPAPYAGNVAQLLGGFAEILGNISMILIFPMVLLHDFFLKYIFIFFLLTLVYDYIIVCIVAKIFQKFNPDWRSFLIIFGILEIVVYIVGSFFTWHAQCSICQIGYECPPCPSGNYSMDLLYSGIIPNLIIAFIISFFSKKYKQKQIMLTK